MTTKRRTVFFADKNSLLHVYFSECLLLVRVYCQVGYIWMLEITIFLARCIQDLSIVVNFDISLFKVLS